MNKNEKIAKTRFETIERHSKMICKVRDIKILHRKMNKKQKKHLEMLFNEAKWFYNTLVWNWIKWADKTVDKEWNEYEMNYLSSQMKQSIYDQTLSSIKSLSSNKKNWRKIWKLKFKSEYNSIDLKQFWNTYNFIDRKLRIQKVPWLLRVKWLKQIDWEIANAKLVNMPDWYHLLITTYVNEDIKEPETKIWIDLWVKNQMVLSNWIQLTFEEIWLPRKNHKKFSKKKKYSKWWKKEKRKLWRKYLSIKRKKKEREIKISKVLEKHFVIFEDLSFKSWQKLWWRKSQEIRLWSLTWLIKYKEKIDRWFPSTKTCSRCWNIKEIKLSERIYECNCWNKMNRDYNASLNILYEWNKNLRPLWSNIKMLKEFKKVPFCKSEIIV